jgi:hypothetical protein
MAARFGFEIQRERAARRAASGRVSLNSRTQGVALLAGEERLAEDVNDVVINSRPMVV